MVIRLSHHIPRRSGLFFGRTQTPVAVVQLGTSQDMLTFGHLGGISLGVVTRDEIFSYHIPQSKSKGGSQHHVAYPTVDLAVYEGNNEMTDRRRIVMKVHKVSLASTAEGRRKNNCSCLSVWPRPVRPKICRGFTK